jgi:DNA-binding transcriptional LysR family regulator
MNLNQLKIFYVSGKHQSFSSAAEELLITQPAVTMQIRELEGYYNLKLFHRHGKRVELTEAGRILFRYAKKIFDWTAQAERAIWELRDLEAGTLKIGTTKTYAKHLMPSLIFSFQEKHPGVHVILSEGSSAEISNSLIVHKNELGLIGRSTYPPQLKVLSFSREELVLIFRRNHPLTSLRKISLADLAREPLIIREKGSGTRDVVLEKYREARIKPSILTEASNVDFIKELVETGNGISFAVKSAVQEELKRGTLKTRTLADGPFYLNVDIVYLKNRNLSPSAQAFLELLQTREDHTPKKMDGIRSTTSTVPKLLL